MAQKALEKAEPFLVLKSKVFSELAGGVDGSILTGKS